MKKELPIALLISIPWIAEAQLASSDTVGLGWSGWVEAARNDCSTTRQLTNYVQTDAGLKPMVSRVVEVATGLNYFDNGTGGWKESKEIIELTPEGQAEAVHAPHKVYFKPDLSSDSDPALTIITKSNRVFQTHPVGIYYYDPVTDQTVELAKANGSATAELLPPNQIVWRSAFRSSAVEADFRITFAKSGLEADVIFTKKPKNPESYLLDGTRVQLQVRHLWLNVPAPGRVTSAVSSNAKDEILDFGDLWFPTGRVMESDQSAVREPNVSAKINSPVSIRDNNAIAVLKHWEAGKTFSILTESVRWVDIEPLLRKLPDLGNQTNINTADSNSAIKTASTPYLEAGVIWDYIIVGSSSPITFATYNPDPLVLNSYWITGNASFGNTVTFNEGCIIKFANNVYLMMYGPVVCSGSDSNPKILTSENEDMFGDRLPVSTGIPTYTSAQALWLYYPSSSRTLSGFQIRWARTAVQADGNDLRHSLNNSSLQWCQTGICLNNSKIDLVNDSKCTLNSDFAGNGSHNGTFANLCSGDADANGIQDSIEYRYWGRLLGYSGANSDDDGDGLSNKQEVNAVPPTCPIDRPVMTSTPTSQIVSQGANASFSCSEPGKTYSYLYQDNSGNNLGWGNPFTLSNTQLSQSGQYAVYAYAPNTKLYSTSPFYVRLVVCDTIGYSIWYNYCSSTNNKSDLVWTSRVNGNPPSATWNTGSLIYGKVGFTGISPFGMDPGNPTQMLVTALTRRHGYMRGHGTGGSNGLTDDYKDRIVWFFTANGSPKQAKVKRAYRRNPDVGGTLDWTVLLFYDELDANITPIPYVMQKPYPFCHAVVFRVGQTPYMTANEPPFSLGHYAQKIGMHDDLSRPAFNNYETYADGDSGAPNLIPSPGGYLIFTEGSSCNLTPQIQCDMNALTSEQGWPTYNLTWVYYPITPCPN